MKIRDNETGEVFEYGTNIHHALMISANGGCLTFENLQNGDGSLESGNGGYSFVLDDGKTPEESTSPDAVNGATYANIGGFHGDTAKNDCWIPVDERLPEVGEYVLGTTKSGEVLIYRYGWNSPHSKKMFFHLCGAAAIITAWMPCPEPYRPERSNKE